MFSHPKWFSKFFVIPMNPNFLHILKPTTKLNERHDIFMNISTSKRGKGGCKKVDVVWLVHKLHTRFLKIKACKGHLKDMSVCWEYTYE